MKSRAYLLATLGMLTALAPVVNNMFSPGTPDMMRAFMVDDATVQLGLTACLLGLALGQVIIGPLSDRQGRRKPLMASMVLLALASAACVWAPSMTSLIVLRVVQGLAAGGGIVIARSVASDISSGSQLLKVLAVVNVFNGLVPIVAPMLGGALASHWGWQGPMAAMLVVAVVLVVACAFLPESLPAASRDTHRAGATIRLFGRVLRNRPCITTILHQGSALAVLFGNIAFTPVLVSGSGYSPGAIGMALGVNGTFTALGAGAAAAMRNAERGMRITSVGLLASAAAMAVVLLADLGLWCYEVVICVMLFFVGVTLTSSSGRAMELARGETGTASALLGAMGFVVGAVVAPVTGLGHVMVTVAVVYALAAVLTALFARMSMAAS